MYLFADINCANLACPIVQVGEKKTMNRLAMVKVESLDIRCSQSLSIAGRGKHTLDFVQFFFRSDVKLVYQDRCTGIAVS